MGLYSGIRKIVFFGPGYTSLANLGNSCYLNSVIQVLFTLPDFQPRYTKILLRDKGIEMWKT